LQQQRHLITSALPYINGVKHLGNLVGSMLPADVYARYLRAQGEDVLFISATDEHGTPAELAALAAGLEVAEYCRWQHEIQRDLCEQFNLSFDHFGRSSSLQNRELTQHFARQLDANGFIEERVTMQAYSPTDGRFLPDRYVVGTCPNCGYDQARGDQCENCTRLLDPEQLIEPRSAVSGSSDIEFRASRHLYLLQSKLTGELRHWLASKTDWPVLAQSIALKWLDEGLEDRSITRDLDWGIPVDRPGFDSKVFYVWFDAPIEYIGATREWADSLDADDTLWRSWWYDAGDVRYVQFMAKDNVPFHAVGFPSTILGSREPWKLVDYLKAFNWLTYYGGKFSTSQARGVFMDDALDLLPADYWRYYLIANAPESSDTDFTWETFAVAVNKDLADTLGNFVNRTLTLAANAFGGRIPTSLPGRAEEELSRKLSEAVASYNDHLADMRFRKAAQQLRATWTIGNSYFNEEAPWRVLGEDPNRAATVLATTVNLVRIFAALSSPIIPATANRLFDALGVSATGRAWPKDMRAELGLLPAGQAFTVPDVLFRKIATSEIEAWKHRFGPPGPTT
jgi:methionyl-tRNA synthetase